MNSPILVPRIFIEAIDNNGTRRNLSCKSWSMITKVNQDTIRQRYITKKKGKNKRTNRQIVGLDPNKANKPAKKIKPLSTLGQLMTDFNRKRLVS